MLDSEWGKQIIYNKDVREESAKPLTGNCNLREKAKVFPSGHILGSSVQVG